MPRLLPDLSRRHLTPELMDDPALDPGLHQHALRGLARINRLSLAARNLWKPIRTLALREPRRPLRVLDLACGDGDTLIQLARLAHRAGLSLELHGCDISATSIALASRRARTSGPAARFFRHDVLGDPIEGDYDLVMSSLFLHHLDHLSALKLLHNMRAAARKMVLLFDLDRSRLGYLAAAIVPHLLTRSPIVHTDAVRSVRAAFTAEEARALAHEAGLTGATVRRCFPCRWLLEWSAP